MINPSQDLSEEELLRVINSDYLSLSASVKKLSRESLQLKRKQRTLALLLLLVTILAFVGIIT